jgi:PPM family protein phosphatase
VIPGEQAHLYVAAITHPGMKGKNNEDRYAVSAHRVGEKNLTPSLLAIVADGVGGHRAGEVAAEMAVEIISQKVLESDASQAALTLREAIVQASQAIYEQATADHGRQGMSTTCACAWVIGSRLYTAAVGDSRIYLIRNQAIHQLTTDHTWVQEATEGGALTPEQARNHPNAHVIRRHLGSQQQVIPDLRLRLNPGENDAEAEANQGARLLPGDRLLLCSDGLTDLVEDEEILEAVTMWGKDEALERLVKLANGRGGHDNITIIALQMPPRSAVLPGATRRKRRSPLVFLILGLTTMIIVGGILIGSLFLAQNLAVPTVTATITSQPGITVAPFFQTTLPPVLTAPPESTPTPTVNLPTAATVTPGALPGSIGSPTANGRPTSGGPTYTPWPTNTPIPEVETGIP